MPRVSRAVLAAARVKAAAVAPLAAPPAAPTTRAAIRARRALEGLTLKQRAFVAYFLGAAAGNATRAAALAGYAGGNLASCAAIANKLLRTPKVVASIDRKASASRYMSSEETLAEIGKVARADVAISERGKVAALTLAARINRLVEDGAPPVNVGVAVNVEGASVLQGRINAYANALRLVAAGGVVDAVPASAQATASAPASDETASVQATASAEPLSAID